MLGQGDDLDPARTIRDELVGGRADHEWPADAASAPSSTGCSAASRWRASRRAWTRRSRRCPAASGGGSPWPRLLLDHPELLLLDEPTNHLDVEGVDWLARHLAARRGSILVITHDRWFLDAVCTHTWEVADSDVHQYEGGYAAYVLARAERTRQAAAREERRQQLIRKELAWLRRGPPARTSKPKFRIEAANALIADEPTRATAPSCCASPPRGSATRCSTPRASRSPTATKVLLRDATWRLGPGDRVAVVGVNGSGKTSLMKLLAGDLQPSTGEVTRGATVRLAFLSQDTVEIPGNLRVLESLEAMQGRARLGDGRS